MIWLEQNYLWILFFIGLLIGSLVVYLTKIPKPKKSPVATNTSPANASVSRTIKVAWLWKLIKPLAVLTGILILIFIVFTYTPAKYWFTSKDPGTRYYYSLPDSMKIKPGWNTLLPGGKKYMLAKDGVNYDYEFQGLQDGEKVTGTYWRASTDLYPFNIEWRKDRPIYIQGSPYGSSVEVVGEPDFVPNITPGCYTIKYSGSASSVSMFIREF